jgi:hypothetical protein
MTTDEILVRLVHGTTLEGPFFTEPVRVLTTKARGTSLGVAILTPGEFEQQWLDGRHAG